MDSPMRWTRPYPPKLSIPGSNFDGESLCLFFRGERENELVAFYRKSSRCGTGKIAMIPIHVARTSDLRSARTRFNIDHDETS